MFLTLKDHENLLTRSLEKCHWVYQWNCCSHKMEQDRFFTDCFPPYAAMRKKAEEFQGGKWIHSTVSGCEKKLWDLQRNQGGKMYCFIVISGDKLESEGPQVKDKWIWAPTALVSVVASSLLGKKRISVILPSLPHLKREVCEQCLKLNLPF